MYCFSSSSIFSIFLGLGILASTCSAAPQKRCGYTFPEGPGFVTVAIPNTKGSTYYLDTGFNGGIFAGTPDTGSAGLFSINCTDFYAFTMGLTVSFVLFFEPSTQHFRVFSSFHAILPRILRRFTGTTRSWARCGTAPP